MMSMPYQVPYQNQLQFNLGVPLSAQNLAVQFNRPSTILVERIGGQHGIPGRIPATKQGNGNVTQDSAFNYSALSEDKMEMMSHLARRDLRNRKLQMQMRGKSPTSGSASPMSSPSRTRLHQQHGCQKFARENVARPKRPTTAKEAGKSRTFGAVQTPPPRRPTSHTRLGDESVRSARDTSMNITKDSDIYFPAKPLVPEGADLPTDEIAKIQQEMEGYLLLIEHVQQRAMSEGNTNFLHPPVKGKQKDGFLAAEEDLDRARIRIGEQNTRSARNVYNLRQKVKQLQRDIAHADLSKPTKKSQITAQLGTVHRGAEKAIQTFVNQLPLQDLRGGLPSHYKELSLLLRQLTALSSLTKQGKQPQGASSSLFSALDRVDNLNTKWCAELRNPGAAPEEKVKKQVVSKEWVSDTKVDKHIFVTKNKPDHGALSLKKPAAQVPKKQQLKQQPQRRGRPVKKAPGKENRGAGVSFHSHAARNAELRSGIAALLAQKEEADFRNQRVPHMSRAVAWEVETGKKRQGEDHTKGFMLPSDLVTKREKAQRAVALSNVERGFAESTISSKQKVNTSRPSSAPSSPSKRKEVNFDLDHSSSPLPWIPPGRSARSRSLSSERRSRSGSRSRSPFYLRDVDRDEVRQMFPGKHSLRTRSPHREVPEFGFRSLPTDKKLRSADVSNSFIDEVEHRLLQRLMGKKAAEEEISGKMREEYYQPSLSREDLTLDTTDGNDETLDTTDPDLMLMREAATVMDAPTLENIRLRLAEMQREQREIRQRWSTMKFTDTKPRSRIFTSSEAQSDRFREPPAIEVTRMSKTERPKHSQGPINKECVEEPLIFTKAQASTSVNFYHTVTPGHKDDLEPESKLSLARPPKKLVSMKQTMVERIGAERDRFESYLRKRSHHPSGKFDPWKLVEEISDEILSDCMKDVASEVEAINEEIANHMYKSEFMVDTSQSGTGLQKEQAMSPQTPPMADGRTATPTKVIDEEPIMRKFTSLEQEPQPMGGMVSAAAWGSGDRPLSNLERSLSQRSHSTPRSPAPLGSGKQSPNMSATEPVLDDVSHFLPHKGDTSEERDERGGGDVKEDDDYDDEEDEESEEDEDDEEEYSEDDFVSEEDDEDQ